MECYQLQNHCLLSAIVTLPPKQHYRKYDTILVTGIIPNSRKLTKIMPGHERSNHESETSLSNCNVAIINV